MISLTVEEKCQNCPEFSPAVERVDMTTLDGDKNIHQTVYCGNKSFCKNLENYLNKK